LFLISALVFKAPTQTFALTLSISGAPTAQVSVFQGVGSTTKTLNQGVLYIFNVSKGDVLVKASSAGFNENITSINVQTDAVFKINLQSLPAPINTAPLPNLSGIKIP
jgi:hypothetical protein